MYVRGHADYSFGDDIVCAGISAIGQTAMLGVTEYEVDVKHCESGKLEFDCRDTVEARAVIKAALRGIDSIRIEYPQCFIEKEVSR